MKHILQNIKTTLVGGALIGAGVYSGITAKTTWTESMTIITAGLGLVMASDSKPQPPQAA